PEGAGFGLAPLDVHMTLDSVALAALPVKVPADSGAMSADITLKGTLKDRIESKVALDLSGIVPTGAKKAGKDPGISCAMKSDVVLELGREQLSVQGGTFTLGQDRGTFEGTVTGLKKSPAWNITVRSDRITPAAILGQLPGLAAKIPPKLSLKGPAAFTLVTTGTRAGFDLKATVDMRPTAMAYGALFDKPAGSPFVFTGAIRKNPEVIQITGLDFDLGPIQAKGSGEVRRMGETSRFQVHINTAPVPLQTAQSLLPMLRKFQPTGNVTVKTLVNGGGGGPMAINVHAASEHMGLVLARPGEGAAPKSKVMAGPSRADMKQVTLTVDAMKKDKALSAQGALNSRGGTFMEVPYATLTGAFRLAGDRLNVTSFDLTALKGSIRGSASYDLKSKAWEAAPVFNNVQAGSILDTLTSFKGVFTGAVTGDLRVRGVAGAPALNSLGAQGNLSISKGEWRNFDLAGTVLSSVLGVPGASEIFGFAPAEVQRYDTTRFESLSTSIDLSRRVINVNTMKLLNITSGRDVDTESSLKGTISMETGEVNLKGNVVLPKRFSQRIGAKAEAFSAVMNDQKRLVLPVSITGSTKKPVPMVQVGALSSAFTKYYTTRALDRGMQKLQEKGRLPAGTDETRKAIDNVFEGLLKKKK
ncbi:MAG TPA: AsmA-like C-terminal region-containing protein, partial [Deltaproteobacteria bacterium]|nr:AsmA-like C-terminal region-containing protein [Deltaproteobacteria bacterium]